MIILSENSDSIQAALAESQEIPEGFTVLGSSADSATTGLSGDQKTIAMLTEQITAYRHLVLELQLELARNRPPF